MHDEAWLDKDAIDYDDDEDYRFFQASQPTGKVLKDAHIGFTDSARFIDALHCVKFDLKGNQGSEAAYYPGFGLCSYEFQLAELLTGLTIYLFAHVFVLISVEELIVPELEVDDLLFIRAHR